MEDLNIDKISLSENVPVEETLIRTEKIDQLSHENLKDHKTSSESKQDKEPNTVQSSEEKLKSVDKTSEDSKQDNSDKSSEEKHNETKKLEETVTGKIVKTEITKIQSCEITRSKKLDKPEIPELVEIKQIKKISDSMPCCPLEEKEKIVRNQSDIFSLKVVPTTLQTSIFSVNGSPSRRVFRKQEPAGHVFPKNEDPPADNIATPKGNRITRENYNDEKRPSSSYRNPLTGTGLSSNDEYKSKGIKRKDGNPLLGLGYDEVAKVTSTHRIPPGGYSHKLW